MNFDGRVGKHLVAIVASMAGGAIAGGGIVLAISTATPRASGSFHSVAEVASPSPDPTPSDSPSPSPVDSPSPTPTAAPAAAPAPAPAAPVAAPAPPPPSPTCPVGQAILSKSGDGRFDGSFQVPTLCSTYTFKWSFGPAPCAKWTLAFYPDVNGQGAEFNGTPASGSGSVVGHSTGAPIQAEVNLYNNDCAVPWSISITAG